MNIAENVIELFRSLSRLSLGSLSVVDYGILYGHSLFCSIVLLDPSTVNVIARITSSKGSVDDHDYCSHKLTLGVRWLITSLLKGKGMDEIFFFMELQVSILQEKEMDNRELHCRSPRMC